ncbi:exonuclease RecJ [Melghirimyces profundicolus]|uniref:Single-stranded-DNA-specific exonuclease RecJ n=1 Tax=Melghirimyces profundicolus TaxID=1242148 RepID=A0A2T6BH12_9BACL|nr:single-stranded-DNA-specific exonuclease RecJ [Melghirimyces profundicolus]PTX55350.1 exonuclease RecJ [Melghirimyces profundicolus]
MLQSKTRWQPVEADESRVKCLTEELGVHPLTARLLINRGLSDPDEARRFLWVSQDALHDPFLMDGMDQAVKRIRKALDRGEKIRIYGDYDADGVSSTSLMMKVFQSLDAHVDYYIPNRFTEGYGLNEGALIQAKEAGIDLVVSVDTGISAAAEAEIAKELDLDLIVTDHHEPPDVLPDAYAVINPKKPGCSYPFDMLAGVGVAFKLAQALLGRFPEELLEIAALGTIADLVPLVDENRVLTALGLEQMNRRQNVGLSALMEVSGVDGDVGAGHVGFSLGPRINAGGRLDTAETAVELLLTEDPEEARTMAEELDRMNRERQKLVEEIAQEACAMVEAEPDKHRRFIVVAAPGWNVGVIGIVASRLVEKYYRPTIVLGIDEETGMAKGSARSITGLDMYRALTECADLLPHFGGHEMAAGMSLPREHLPDLHKRLDRVVGERLSQEDYIPLSKVEADLGVADVDVKLVEELERLAPFGMGNPTPRFRLKGAQLSKLQRIGREKNHLKFLLEDQERTLEAIGFRLGELAEEIAPSARPELLGELSINEWNNRRFPQLMVRDLTVPHLQVFDWRSNGDKSDRFRRLAGESTLFVIGEGMKGADWTVGAQTVTWEEISQGSVLPVSGEVCHLVFADLPPSVSVFEGLLRRFTGVKRVYFAFGDAELDGSLARTPDREHFKRLYASMLRKSALRLPSDLERLSRMTGLSANWISFMIKVFDELGFVTMAGNRVEMVSRPPKRPLTASRLYREQRERDEVQHAFVYSSYRDLCERIHSVFPGDPD